jgi:hypothetical protein
MQISFHMSKQIKKPFYFIIVLWGERYRNYFLEYCLPSLLSPGNIPELRTERPSKFLIVTTPEDWSAIAETPIFNKLKQHIEPVFVEIPPCPAGRSGCEHMSSGHKLACNMAYHDQALGLVLTPDSMLSDGTAARLQDLARAGTELVVVAALRFGEEPFFAHLSSMGVIPLQRRSDSAQPLVISGRQMAHAAVNAFHPETLSYEWEGPYLFPIIPAAWWRVPNENGVVLHCLSWAPLLLDYSAVTHHDTSMLDGWTIDGDYLFKNMGNSKRVHVVQDSDEMFIASWAPMAEHASVFQPIRFFQTSFGRRLHRLLKDALFRASFYSSVFDPFKREAFFLPVRWHGRPLNPKWSIVEEQAMRSLRKRVAPPSFDDHVPLLSWRLITVAPSHLGMRLLRLVIMVALHRGGIARRLGQALRGDIGAIRRIIWRVQHEAFSLTGRTLQRSAPPLPQGRTKRSGERPLRPRFRQVRH